MTRCTLIALLILLTGPDGFATPVPTGRYTALLPVPTRAQAEPLTELITLSLPATVATVGEAVQAALLGTGYRLTEVLQWETDLGLLFAQPLPRVHRELGPLPVLRVLQTLVGPGFVVVVDPVHRLVGFQRHATVSRLTPPAPTEATQP